MLAPMSTMEEYIQWITMELELDDISGPSPHISSNLMETCYSTEMWVEDLLNASKHISTVTQGLPYSPSSTRKSSLDLAQPVQNLTFNTNDNHGQPVKFSPEHTQQQVFQTGTLLNEQVLFTYSDLSTMECIDTGDTDVYSSTSEGSDPLRVSDYNICTPEVNGGILLIHSMDLETLPPIPTDTICSQEVGCRSKQEIPPYPLPFSALENDSELALTLNPSSASNVIQVGLTPSVPVSNSITSSEVPCSSSIYNWGQAQNFIPMFEEDFEIGAKQNTVCQFSGECTYFTKADLLVEKILTPSDIGNVIPGILLHKKEVERNFPPIFDGKALPITMHDAKENGKTWIMRLTAITTTEGTLYRLKGSLKYTKYHSLEEGDWLGIFRQMQEDRIVVQFQKRTPVYTISLNKSHTDVTAWTQIIRKKLSKTDAKMGLTCSGSIFLAKKEVEAHFPPVQDKEGYPVSFHDWDSKCTWAMRLKFKSKCRVYMLRKIGGFMKLHGLGEGDVLEILKSESLPVTYSLMARKFPSI